MTTRHDDHDDDLLTVLPRLECSECGAQGVGQLHRPEVRGRTVDAGGVTHLLPPMRTRAFVFACDCGNVVVDHATRTRPTPLAGRVPWDRPTVTTREHAEALGDVVVFTIDTSPTDELLRRRARALGRWLTDVAAHARRLEPRVVRACLDESELERVYTMRAIDEVRPMFADVRRDLIAERLP